MAEVLARPITLRLAPIGLREANALVYDWHRHHGPVRGHKFSVAVVGPCGEPHGVAIAGRPRARGLDDGLHLEVLRVATDGAPNACSMLYGAVRRAALGMGYLPQDVLTYTLAEEHGGSLRAAGWHRDTQTSGGTWDTPSRPRVDEHPIGPKVRWRAAP